VPKFLGELKAEARGIHLHFLDGFSQMAVTYRVRGRWRRKYSVILPNPDGGPATEFMFTFGFLGSFQGFLRMTPVIERMVQSLKWGDRPTISTPAAASLGRAGSQSPATR
jgi:hypothetical protein